MLMFSSKSPAQKGCPGLLPSPTGQCLSWEPSTAMQKRASLTAVLKLVVLGRVCPWESDTWGGSRTKYLPRCQNVELKWSWNWAYCRRQLLDPRSAESLLSWMLEVRRTEPSKRDCPSALQRKVLEHRAMLKTGVKHFGESWEGPVDRPKGRMTN